MKCPYCGFQDSKVVDSRGIDDGIRRRRQCLHCSARFTTYAIEGERGSGVICMNGAAARLVYKGDTVIIISYCTLSDFEAHNNVPKLVYVNFKNQIVKKSKEICPAFSGN